MSAIRAVLAAYRSTEATVTEEQITAAWAEYDDLCSQRNGSFPNLDVSVIRDWVNGKTVLATELTPQLREALAHYGSKPWALTDAAVEAAARVLHDAHGGDLEEWREDAAAALMAAAGTVQS